MNEEKREQTPILRVDDVRCHYPQKKKYVRSDGTVIRKAVVKAVDGVIKSRLTEGQLDECGLTMHDLKLIKQTICRAIPASMHNRIDYNKAKERR